MPIGEVRDPSRIPRENTRTKVAGIEEIKRALGQLPQRLENKVIRQAMRAGLKPVLARAKELVPRGKTGNLRRLLKLKAGKKRRRGLIILNVQAAATIDVSANKTLAQGHYAKGREDHFYGAMVEFGHDIVRDGQKASGGTVVGYYPGSHYLERAFGQTAQGANATTCRMIVEGIEREVVVLSREGGTK
jgi:hypothetical protein